MGRAFLLIGLGLFCMIYYAYPWGVVVGAILVVAGGVIAVKSSTLR